MVTLNAQEADAILQAGGKRAVQGNTAEAVWGNLKARMLLVTDGPRG